MLADFHDPVDVNALAALIAQAVKSEMQVDLDKLTELWRLEGLDPSRPLTVTDNTRDVGTEIHQTVDTNNTRTIVTRE